MVAFKLAYRNLIGAGIRTWLNVFVLSLSFVLIIWHKGLLDGWNRQARLDTIKWEVGGGQYWQKNYDPYDPFTLSESHDPIPRQAQRQIIVGELAPILITRATIYPQGRMQSVLLKGIDPDQNILTIPSHALAENHHEIPALIGGRMAKNTGLDKGDLVTLRWRDTNGTFDAADIRIIEIFKTSVPAVDNGQIWIPIERLQKMTNLTGEATILVAKQKYQPQLQSPDWQFKGHVFLFADMEKMIEQKSVGGSIIYIILMALALLAIFDTQVLSVFRRQKEIGTLVALGMTRGQVVRLFTFEGAMHAILAAIMAAAYGIPLLSLQAVHGIAMPRGTDDYGFAIADKIYPTYSVALVIGTTLLILITTTIVSYLPAKRISKMKPADAIRGKIQ